jgi:hypothetical protein
MVVRYVSLRKISGEPVKIKFFIINSDKSMTLTSKTFIFISSLLLFSLLPNGAVADQVCKDYIPDNAPDSRYFDHKDGTISDSYTGLMWKQCAEGRVHINDCASGSVQVSWKEALEMADRETFAGYSDWRLPNLTELKSLVRNKCYKPSINMTYFVNSSMGNIWSSSTARNVTEALVVNLEHGEVYIVNRNIEKRVRLVRFAF